MAVLVLDKRKQPLMPCSEKRARLLLSRGKAAVPAGKKAGAYTGRVAVRASGSFNLQTAAGAVQGISHRHCRLIQRGDGYAYFHSPTPKEERGEGRGDALRRALSLPGLKAEVSRAS